MFCSIVISIDNDFLMGIGNNLVYRSSKDLKNFSKITKQAGTIVMGRKTWDSLPIKPLPGRKNIIISRSMQLEEQNPNVEIYSNLEDLFNQSEDSSHLCFIGGYEILQTLYNNYPHYIDLIRLTRFNNHGLDHALPNSIYFPQKILEDFMILNKDIYTDTVQVYYQNNESVCMNIEYIEYIPKSKNRIAELSGELQYLHMMRELLQCPLRDTRNGAVRSKFGYKLKYDCRNGKIPLLTTKKVAWKTVIKELLWFLQGNTNNKDLKRTNVHIWDLNSTREFLDSRGLTDYEEDDCGPIYGFQWRHFGAEYKGHGANYAGEGIDQLELATNELLLNPFSRRIVISAWNASDLTKMCLPPCHVLMQFYIDDEGLLSLQFYQRSMDCFLGAPFNMASYAVLLHIMAQKVGKKTGWLHHVVGDYHIYANHEDAIRTQLRNPILESPTLNIKCDASDWNDYSIDDFELVGYSSAGKISAPMSA